MILGKEKIISAGEEIERGRYFFKTLKKLGREEGYYEINGHKGCM